MRPNIHRQPIPSRTPAKNYGLLVGVAALTIYNWESEKARPRAKQLSAWGTVRRTGKREALRRLELLG